MRVIRIIFICLSLSPLFFGGSMAGAGEDNDPPRKKYTPYALEYIQQAKTKILEKKTASLSQNVEIVEMNMLNEVIKRQIPPYIEPPIQRQAIEPSSILEPSLIRKKLKEKKITLDFDKVDLKSVVSFLSSEAGINIVVSQKVLDIGAKVTAKFKDAPAEEAIKYITKSLGFIYRIDKDVVWIAHPEEVANEALETRVYYLSKGGGLFTQFSPISTTSETGLGGSSAQVQNISTIEDTLKEVISWPADAKFVYDKRINALVVRNTPQNLQMLEDMLYNLDVTPYQILIEARFLEVDVTDTSELGLEWKVNENAAFQTKGGSFSHGIGQDSGVDFNAFTNAAEGMNFTYKGLLTAPQFQAVLHALEKSSKIKTLSSPRITTLNNQLATIKVVEYEIVQFDTNGDGDYNDAGETTYKNVPKDFMRRDVGILLKVIPSVGQDRKTVSLSLIPEVSEGTENGFSYTGDVSLPKFTSRNLSTTVVVNSGDTIVLGGLIKESRTKTVTKVPILGDIPLLGAFFKKNSDSIQRKNLLIFVTAKVLSPSGDELVAQK
jgi:type II secretory pathway component GspD/PulD (secretin)